MEAKQQELEYYIYITTNMLNGMQYLGQHTHKIGTKDSYLGSGVRLVNAIKKYKKENFHKEILYHAFDENELNEIEVWYIKHLDAVNDSKFYNLHCGGSVQHGKNNAAYRAKNKRVKCVETGVVYDSLREVERELNIHYQTIVRVCKGKSTTAGNYTWEYVDEETTKYENKTTCREVYCLTNNEYYKSTREAAISLGLSNSMISAVCNGKFKQAKGYVFKYTDGNVKRKRCIKIKCLNDNKEFKTIKEASIFYNINDETIRRHISGINTPSMSLKFIKLTD